MQRFLAIHKITIIRLWYLLLAGWLLFFLASIQLLTFAQWLELGLKSASVSLIVFWLTLLPGILKRFRASGVFLPLRTMMMLFRRQMGITMYVFALTHLMWVRFLPVLLLGGNLLFFSPFELAGVAAFTLLTPVFITSNEWSVRTLGHAWRTIHALVYLVIWLVFAHVALQGTSWQAGGTLVIAILETASLFWDALHKPKAPVSVPPQPSA